MKPFPVAVTVMSVIVLSSTLVVPSAWAGQEGKDPRRKSKVELPAAVVRAVKDNCPDAEIANVDLEKEAGIALNGIEFKAGQGEIEVAPDGKITEAPKWHVRRAKGKEEGEEKAEAEENEEKGEAKPAHVVDLKILPAAVLNAFRTTYPNAVIKGTSKEVEKGVTYYEVESVDGKLNRDLLYTADGKAVEIEVIIAPESLPTAVLQALGKAYPGYKILKAEDMIKNGRRLYELRIQVKDKKIGLTVDPNGEIFERP